MRWNACVHRLDLGLYSHPKEFLGNGVRTHVNAKAKIPCTGKILLRGGSNLRRCIRQDSEPNTLPTELYRPLTAISKLVYLWPCQTPGVVGSVLRQVGPVSKYCEWMRWEAGSATHLSVGARTIVYAGPPLRCIWHAAEMISRGPAGNSSLVVCWAH